MKYLVSLIIMVFTCITTVHCAQTTGQDMANQTAPKDVIFCWDIHNTLVSAQSWNRAKMSLKSARLFAWGKGWLPDFKPYKVYKKAIKESGSHSAEYIADAFSQKAQEYRTRAQSSKSKHKYYQSQAKRYEKLAETFNSFELQYSDMEGIVPLLKNLKQNGYTHHYVASNIGSGTYPKMKEKFPEIFNDEMVQDCLVANTWEQPIIKKPNPEYFERLKKKINQSGNKTIVFIDDEPRNIKAAQEAGLVAIKFSDTKKLIKDLSKVGIKI